MYTKETIAQLVATVLDGTELRLKADAYKLAESLEGGPVDIDCDLHDERSGQKQSFHGRGVGIVDAAFNGLIGLYSETFQSLRSIRFADFSIKASVDTGRDHARSDMAAKVTLRVENSEGRDFTFEHASPSITRSSLAVVLQCVEFFINSERAFIVVYRALQHARAQKRPDSVARYTAQLTTLVDATSYSEVIETIRRTELSSAAE